MCKCFVEHLKKVENEKVLPSIKGNTSDFKINWVNEVFFFDSKEKIPVVIPIEYSYRGEKVDGSPCKNLTKGTVNMIMRFCPFCGEDSTIAQQTQTKI